MNELSPRNTQSTWHLVGEWLMAVDETDPVKARRGRLAAGMLLCLQVVLLLPLLTALIQGQSFEAHHIANLLVALLWPGLFLLNRHGRIDLAGMGMSGLLLVVIGMLLVAVGPQSPIASLLAAPIILAGLFASPVYAIVAAAVSGVFYLALNVVVDPGYFSHIFSGDAAQTLYVYLNIFIIGAVAWLFSRTTHQALQERQEMGLALVEEREQMLSRLTMQTQALQASMQIFRAVVGQRELTPLLADIVRLVRGILGYEHVQIFMIDEDQSYAVLRSSSGTQRSDDIEAGHQLAVGSYSLIGQVAATGMPLLARETDKDPVLRRNEMMPDTRSELALPLLIDDRVIGVLDVQSVSLDTFNEDVISSLQLLCGQLAISIENARLFGEAEEYLRNVREMGRDMSQRTWAEFLAEVQEGERYQTYGQETPDIRMHRSGIVERVLRSGSVLISSGKDGNPAFLAVPVVVASEVVGVLGVEPDGEREWTQDDMLLMEGVAERTALAVENARLYIQSQRAAEREHLIGAIAEKMQRAPSLALLLESAAQELSNMLGTENVYAEISVDRPMARRRRSVSVDADAAAIASPESTVSEQSPPDESGE